MDSRPPLYDDDAAASLRKREVERPGDDEKFALLIEALRACRPCRRVVDIGCGWGQLLGKVAAAGLGVEELWGVDESADRARGVAEACPRAKVVICRADRLDLPDGHFDAAVAGQVLHEVKLFGSAGELRAVLGEVHRVLAPGGRLVVLDHQDAGEGEVVVSLPPAERRALARFEDKFHFYNVLHEETPEGDVRISRRGLQDFLTKAWSLGGGMEAIEMSETHNVFRRGELTQLLDSVGFTMLSWRGFADITADLARRRGRLRKGSPWHRKFLLVAERP